MMEKALLIPRPGAKFGYYPERSEGREPWAFYPAQALRASMLAVKTPSRATRARFLETVRNKQAQVAGRGFHFIEASASRLRGRLVLDGFTPDRVAEAFALFDEGLWLTLRKRLHDTQFLAGWLMLERRLIEMQTGEGKTLAVALAAATGALAGIPVHVITANDYLVERDAAVLKPVLQLLGLTVGAVTSVTQPAQRREAYRRDVTYCVAKELAFDYLRDGLTGANARSDFDWSGGEPYLRGLCMAIVDEADSVLIDEARMPLVLADAAPNREQSAFHRQALFLAAQLREGEDYEIDKANLFSALTPCGADRAARLACRMGGAWNARLRREEMLSLALAAQHLFVKDRHYLVRDKRIFIIDETTGRIAEGRKWSRGLHQLIELKEGCPPSAQQETSAQTTFQRFFARYLRLSGVSGTLSETRGELLAIYGLPVVNVPLRLPNRRVVFPDRMFMSPDARWRYVVERVSELRTVGRPVLIGTNSVSDSELLSRQLVEAGVPHTVLNARFDAAEADIVARAGLAGAVTVATNMAGRGTDIVLGEGVRERGGLHVIACQDASPRRIDRQLYGRCARQGDPGSVEHLRCLEGDASYAEVVPWIKRLADGQGELPSWLARVVSPLLATNERRGRQERWFLFFNDRLMNKQLAFAGGRE